MTIVHDIDRVDRALAAGEPVVVPAPAPLPYVVAGTDAAAVNTAKGRPAEQPAGMVVADLDLVAPYVDLDDETLGYARWLTADQLLNLLLPVRDGWPRWMAPSVSRGRLAIMLSWLARLRPLLAARGHLYVSSANRTGGEVAVTAAAADAALDGRLLVLDGDAERGPLGQPGSSGSAAIVAVGPGRRLQLLRHGVNDAPFDGDDAAYLDTLERRWATRG